MQGSQPDLYPEGDSASTVRPAQQATHGHTSHRQAGRHKQRFTHHITNGGDVSDSHLVHSVPITAIFMK